MGLTRFTRDLLITWLFTNSSATRPTTWFLGMHTGDPGVDGDANEVTVGIDADYVRQAITYADPVVDSGQVLNDLAATFTANAGATPHTVTHLSVWKLSAVGDCLMSGQMPVSKDIVGSDVTNFAIDEIIQALI